MRLFTAAELEQLLSQAGFHIAQRFGDYDGGALTTESARVILVGART